MKKTHNPDIALLLSAGIITALYVSLIFNQNIWTDEAFTIQLVGENDIAGIIKGTAADVHPPLYYLIVKLFVSLLGPGFWVYKLVSVIPMALTMLLAVWYIRPWFGTRTAFLFLLFLNAIPCVMEYGVQIRMYSWSIFFLTLAALAVYGVIADGRGKYWCILSAAALCACYTHNFAMISAVFLYLLMGIYLVFRKGMFSKKTELLRWFLSGTVVGVCFIPWLLVLMRQTRDRVDNYWIEPVTASTVRGYFGDLFGSGLPYTEGLFAGLLLIAVVSLCAVRGRAGKDRFYVAALLGVPFLTASAGVLVSVWLTPFFIARYLVPCMGLSALALAVCFGAGKERYPLSFWALCAFLAAMTGSSYAANYADEYYSTHTDALLCYMEENMGEKDVILYNNQPYGFIYECYFEADRLCFLEDMDFASDYDTIWYFDSCVSPWLPDAVLAEHRLKKEYVDTTGIEQNDFVLYRISRQELE